MIQVQTYEIEEATSEAATMAADSEAAELIEKLGLHGQKGLLNVDTCTRFPYRKMTKLEHLVFKLIFPERSSIKSYSLGIIPVRVLQVAAYVNDEAASPVNFLRVWHAKTAKEDPILVGHTADYGGEFYLLARWGDALLPVEEMVDKAKAIWKANAASILKKQIQENEQDLAMLNEYADEAFTSGQVSGPNNYRLNDI